MAIVSSLQNAALGPSLTSDAPALGDDVSPAPEDTSEPQVHNDGAYGRDEDTSVKDFLIGQIDSINLAENYAPDILDKLGQLVVFEYNIDENSRADWKDKAEKAMKFATQEAEEKQYPWPKASNVVYPLITQAAIQFNARTYPAIIQNRNVVKGVVWGSDKGTPATVDGKPDSQPKLHPDGSPIWLSAPGEKRKRADRIGEHMSWQLLDEMPEWENQTDQLLMQIPIMGGACRKTFRDPMEGRNRSLLVPLKNLVWNYHAPSFEDAPRHTEILTLYPHQIEEYERANIYLPLVYGPGGGDESNDNQADAGDQDAPHVFLEQHRRYDLDGDGYPEPYIVTVHKRSSKVVRIVARYAEEGIVVGKGADVDEDDDGALSEDLGPDEDEILKVTPVDHYTLIPFLPNPDGGSYPVGFGHLLRPLNEAINTSLNQMFDAGHLQNAGGGFVSDQLSIHSGPVNFQVGKYVRVGSKGQAIKDAVFPIPFHGPSPVLFQLLGMLMTSAKEVAAVKDILAGDAAIANAPPTTVLALIEQGLKVYTAIHKRVYRALKSEFGKLYRLNRLYLKEGDGRYKAGDEWREVTPEDYRLGGGVEPIADPTMITDMQRLGRAQILLGFKGDPLIQQKEVYTRLFDAANIDRVEELFVPPPNPQVAAQIAALAMEEKQAELGRLRAAELKDNSQAYLNMAMAASKANGPQMDWINAQLRVMEMHIEATNTLVKAADVESKHRVALYGHLTKQAASNRDDVADIGADVTANSPNGNTPFPQMPPGPIAAPAPGATAPQAPSAGLPPLPGPAPSPPLPPNRPLNGSGPQ